MAAFTYTYSSLKTAMQAYYEDTGSDVTGSIDDMIGRAEVRIFRDLDLDVFRKTSTASTSTSDRYLSKPTDFVIARNMTVTASSVYYPVKHRTISFIQEFWATVATEGRPRFFADWDDDTFLLAPTPDAAYTMTLAYTYVPARLDGTTTTTFLSTDAPELLFAACMLELSIFMKSEKNIGIWSAAYQVALTKFKEQNRRSRLVDGYYGEP